MAIESVNPATGERLQSFQPLGSAALERRVAASTTAFRDWARRPVEERARVIARAGEILASEKAAFGALMTLEMGKLIAAAEQEADKCALACRHYAERGPALLRPEMITETASAYEAVFFQPLGPILAVMPWNFPFWQVIRAAAPVLMAGNVFVLKHASNVPQCALALEDLFLRAGAPEGVFQSLLVGADKVADLIADDRIAAVTVTGSEGAGRQIAAAAGKAIKKVVLELGGSDPFIVLESADIERALATAVKARMVNSGQSCIAAKRFIVAERIYERFADSFSAAVGALKVGDPMSRDTEVGPLALRSIRDGVTDQVTRSIAAGARPLSGARVLDGPGYFYSPTVLGDVPAGAPAAREEVFGPVAALFRVRDIEEAIAVANGTTFGLGASAWTRDRDEARRLAAELEAGSVFINGMVASDPNFPFGGIKRSGHGRELGDYGVRELVNVKTVRMRFD
jgi:succinate-semialdehyde dehydrogenase/glutarate-semialdehyde dehydrogenase